MNYDCEIAKAARDWIAAKRDPRKPGKYQNRLDTTYEKLTWLIDAEKRGENPGKFRSNLS